MLCYMFSIKTVLFSNLSLILLYIPPKGKHVLKTLGLICLANNVFYLFGLRVVVPSNIQKLELELPRVAKTQVLIVFFV